MHKEKNMSHKANALFNIFKINVGSFSYHLPDPLHAARQFSASMVEKDLPDGVKSIHQAMKKATASFNL